ncbi:MAG: methyltransferase domain-containing protein [Methylobacterium frigidaeris]
MNLHRSIVPARLNLGSGKDFRLEYLNVDVDPSWYPDIVADLSTIEGLENGLAVETARFGALTLQPDSFDEILAHDVLGHVSNLVGMMTSCLTLLRFGGILDINVPYDLSFGAWQDPTHLRTFNEKSWNYYSDWFWYLGWNRARFDMESLQYVLSPVGNELHQKGLDGVELTRMPRSVDALRVRLRKVELSEEDRRNWNVFREGPRQESQARAAMMANARALAEAALTHASPAPAAASIPAPVPVPALRAPAPVLDVPAPVAPPAPVDAAAEPSPANLAPFPDRWNEAKDRYCLWVVAPDGYVHHQAFAEVAEGLQEAFAELGGSAPIVYEPAEWRGRLPIVFGAHLLTRTGVPPLPEGSIVVNLEQISDESRVLTREYFSLLRKYPVLDFSDRNRKALVRAGVTHAGLLDVGYSPGLTRIRSVPQTDKDIDVLFYGSTNERRARILSALQEKGLTVANLFGVYGEERDAMIARAKVVLNLHYYRASIFEAVRVSYLLANRVCVVSEGEPADPDAARFAGGLELVPYDALVRTCSALAADPVRREAIAEAGFARIRASRQADLLRARFFPDAPEPAPLRAAAAISGPSAPNPPEAREVVRGEAAGPLRHLPEGYAVRSENEHFIDAPTGIVHQHQVYELAAYLIQRGGFERIIDVGCGSGEKLRALDDHCQIICIDAAPMRDLVAANLPKALFVGHDLETGLPRLNKQVLSNAIIICSNVIEHLREPEHLLRDLARMSKTSAYTLLSTPDRVRARGLLDQGPPANPARTMEWTADELGRFMRDCGFAAHSFLGYTLNNDHDLARNTILSISGREAAYVPQPTRRTVAAIINVFNENDVIGEVVRYLHGQGIEVHVIDNWSTDGSLETVLALAREGICARVLRFPEQPTDQYLWADQLRHTTRYAATLSADWVIHYDADELRMSPWRGVSLVDAIGFVDACGYTAIDFTVVNFPFIRGQAPRPFSPDHYRFFDFGRDPSHLRQIKGWKNTGQAVDLASTGGHVAQFRGQRVFPLKFLNRHYPLRSPEQAMRKVFRDRLPRIEKERSELRWHTHYDTYEALKVIEPWRRQELTNFDPNVFEAEYLVERLTGIGIETDARAVPNIDTRFRQDAMLRDLRAATEDKIRDLAEENAGLRDELARLWQDRGGLAGQEAAE